MLNSEKFKTAEERAKACKDFLRRHGEYNKIPYIDAAMMWLELEAEEEELWPCPFCGGDVYLEDGSTNSIENGWFIECRNDACLYSAGIKRTRDEAIAAHNRVAKARYDAKESKVENG